jgi:uncharacterized protein HemX
MIYFLASNPDYEDIGIKTILITGVISLSVVIRYLYKQHAKELKEKDEAHQKALKEKEEEHRREIKEKEERIMAVIKDHQNDVKEFNTDTKSFIEKYHQFTNQIKELIYAK